MSALYCTEMNCNTKVMQIFQVLIGSVVRIVYYADEIFDMFPVEARIA